VAIEEKKSVKKHTDIMPELKGKCVCFLHDETDANPAMRSQINSLVREAVNTLVDASITWICENKSKYLCRGVKELGALSDVVKAHKNLLIMDNTRKKEILDNFFASFVNNLWFYENGLYKKENTITTRYVGCYFVGYRHYNGETYHFPLAALKSVLKDEEKIDFVIEAFSKKCADEFSKYCDEALLKLDKNSGASVAEKSTSNKITFFLWTVFSVFLFISGATLLIGK